MDGEKRDILFSMQNKYRSLWNTDKSMCVKRKWKDFTDCPDFPLSFSLNLPLQEVIQILPDCPYYKCDNGGIIKVCH